MIITPFGFNKFKASVSDGPNTWYYSAGWSDAHVTVSVSTPGWAGSTNIYGGLVTISTGGTVTKLAAKLNSNDGSSITAKIGIYTTAGSLVASGTTTAFTGTTAEWQEATMSNSITAGDYYIMFIVSSDQGLFWFNGADGNGKSGSASYAAMPVSTLPTLYDETNTMPGVRVYVD